MDERKKQIIQGYNEIYNKVNAVKLLIFLKHIMKN